MSAVAKSLRTLAWALAIPVVVLVKLAIRPFEKPRVISREKILEILKRRISASPDQGEWDEFVCSPIADTRLESIRHALADLDERFTAATWRASGDDYLVPYVESEQEIFLKSIIPSRKATRDFLTGDK